MKVLRDDLMRLCTVQAPVTAAGEYLMMLPQHLEALLAGGEDSSAIDAEWLDKVRPQAAPPASDVSSHTQHHLQTGFAAVLLCKRMQTHRQRWQLTATATEAPHRLPQKPLV